MHRKHELSQGLLKKESMQKALILQFITMRTKNVKNEVNRRIKEYYKTSLENSTNSKDSWNIINELLNKK